MSFIHDILDGLRERSRVAKERKEFLMDVEEQTKPIRRAAYLEQMKREAIPQGEAMAKTDAIKKVPAARPSSEGFTIGDPYKFIRDNKTQPIKSRTKK